ncbi:hypothetical protein HMPREF1141_3544 [Clostridium sp. MSTE9]|nr:hypothetical protein HMPREF1141_3544 [Clostridium sp. MSTE9]
MFFKKACFAGLFFCMMENMRGEGSTMTKLLLGTIFLFLDYSLPFGNGVLGLLPDFVGYALLWFGAKELDSYGDRFEDTRLYSLILLPVTGIIYVLDALGVTNLLGVYGLLALRVLMTCAALFVSYCLIFAINQVEVKLRRPMDTVQLMDSWRVSALFLAMAYVMLLVSFLARFSSMVLLAAGLYYVICFARSWLKYLKK